MSEQPQEQPSSVGVALVELLQDMVNVMRKTGIPRRMIVMAIEEFWDQADKAEAEKK